MILSHVKHVLVAVKHSLSGLFTALEEAAFRVELVLFIILVPLALLLEKTPLEKAVLIASMFLVLIVEILNSAIEHTVDRISTKLHILSKKAKDLGSAAVFLSIINSAVMWFMIVIYPCIFTHKPVTHSIFGWTGLY